MYDSFFSDVSRWLQVRLVPCSGHLTISGDERGVTVYFRDVTRLREAERSRAEAEARFRVMADVAPVLIWTSGVDSKYDWFNKPRLNFTGRKMNEELGHGWAESVHPDDCDRCVRTYLDSFNARVPCTMEYRLKHHNGEWRWLLDNGVPRYNEVGEFVGYVGSCIDITELKEAQERADHMLAEEQRLVAELLEASFRQRRFLREMLLGFTEGRLHLCNCSSDLPKPLPPLSESVDLSSPTIRLLRKQVVADAHNLQFSPERLHDFETAVGEASMNAVQHGGGGRGRVHGDPHLGVVQVWVEDRGTGIADEFIHRAVEQGWTTGGFGQGFFLMRSCADRIYLLTGPKGTTVVLEQERTVPEPAWLK
jgi:PAS domain S-box-containing protein